MDSSTKKVALLVHNYFEKAELAEPLKVLKNLGVAVDVITTADTLELTSMEGDVNKSDTFVADAHITDVTADSYDALVVPGGTVNADTIRTDASAQAWVVSFINAGKPMAVICHGPWLLISSGMAMGRKLTSYPSLRDDIVNAGADWSDAEVVVDANLITSRNPDDLPAFCSALVSALQAI